jgi:signal transduction histidine kinase
VRTPHATDVESGELKLRIYTRWATSPAIILHLKLLARMVGHFYEAKQREQMQRQSAYTHAIYETGARLTHDVKNLLQSLKSLCSAAGTATPEQAPALQALMQRQLPQITQRLNTTLDKLQSPQRAQASEQDARAWWESLRQRYAGRNIQFGLEGTMRELALPAEVFDSVADNLIENALNKAAAGAALEVRVTFSTARSGTLKVCDTGAAIAKSIEVQLFGGAVASNTGFGVGLYQSARLAAQSGYRLALDANAPGNVCFVLSGQVVESAAETNRQVA